MVAMEAPAVIIAIQQDRNAILNGQRQGLCVGSLAQFERSAKNATVDGKSARSMVRIDIIDVMKTPRSAVGVQLHHADLAYGKVVPIITDTKC